MCGKIEFYLTKGAQFLLCFVRIVREILQEAGECSEDVKI